MAAARTQPRFITLEGGEGAGKSTQIRLLAESLTAAGIPVVSTREPGGSKGGEAIRKLVVSGQADHWQPATETLLFMAARLDHVENLIKPALAKGRWVLCDRFHDSTYVYQGIAKHVGPEWLDQLYSVLLGTFTPSLTLLLDLDPEVGLKRADARGNRLESRFENMGITYHKKLREGFLTLAKSRPQRIVVLDATPAPGKVHQAIVDTVNARFGLMLKTAKAA